MCCFVLKNKGILAQYRPAVATGLPEAYQDKEHTFTGFSARARIILVNTEQIPVDNTIKGLADFLDPKWKGKTAIANPLFGTTSYHVAALFSLWGEEKAKLFLNALKENGCRVVSSNGEVRRLVSRG